MHSQRVVLGAVGILGIISTALPWSTNPSNVGILETLGEGAGTGVIVLFVVPIWTAASEPLEEPSSAGKVDSALASGAGLLAAWLSFEAFRHVGADPRLGMGIGPYLALLAAAAAVVVPWLRWVTPSRFATD